MKRFNDIPPLESGTVIYKTFSYRTPRDTIEIDACGDGLLLSVDEARLLHEWLGRALPDAS